MRNLLFHNSNVKRLFKQTSSTIINARFQPIIHYDYKKDILYQNKSNSTQHICPNHKQTANGGTRSKSEKLEANVSFLNHSLPTNLFLLFSPLKNTVLTLRHSKFLVQNSKFPCSGYLEIPI